MSGQNVSSFFSFVFFFFVVVVVVFFCCCCCFARILKPPSLIFFLLPCLYRDTEHNFLVLGRPNQDGAKYTKLSFSGLCRWRYCDFEIHAHVHVPVY